jgi:hypothetical protein
VVHDPLEWAIDLIAQRQGGMMGGGMGPGMMSKPMMMGGDPKQQAEMLAMRGEMMKAMGDIMMKYAQRAAAGKVARRVAASAQDTFVIADLAGYTALTQAHGGAEAAKTVPDIRSSLRVPPGQACVWPSASETRRTAEYRARCYISRTKPS